MNKFLLLIICSFMGLSASMLSVGSDISMLDEYKYETQKSLPIRIPHETKLVIIAFKKATGKTVNEFLETKEKYYLEKNKTVFIADVHKVPRWVTNVFTLPKMKTYEHPIHLHYEKEFTKHIPKKKKQITILHIKDRKIVKLEFISLAEELQAIIEK